MRWSYLDQTCASPKSPSVFLPSHCQDLLQLLKTRQQEEPSNLCICSASCWEDDLRSKTDPYHQDIWKQIGNKAVRISAREERWRWLGMKEVNLRQAWKHLGSFLKCQKMHEPIPSTSQTVEEMCADMRNVFRWNMPEFISVLLSANTPGAAVWQGMFLCRAMCRMKETPSAPCQLFTNDSVWFFQSVSLNDPLGDLALDFTFIYNIN